MKPRNQFTFYKSYYDAIQGLGKRDQAAIILAVCAYALYEQQPEGLSPSAMSAFLLIKPTLDSGRKKSQQRMRANAKVDSGRNSAVDSGRNKGERELESESELKSKLKNELEVEAEVEREGEGAAPGVTAAATEKKLQLFHGQLGKGVVMLSQAQVEDLLNKLDLDAFDFYVAKLADFILKNNAKVRSHYETILKWWREDSRVQKGDHT